MKIVQARRFFCCITGYSQRLFLLGDLATPDTTGTIYESILEVAVKNFQDRHGLAVDGAIGPST
ncbi:MAG: peptidoglycan-binding protein [Chitinophagaceae bacterium]|nr:peptidoglycan-binding protein [Chitinophagaceae bacterium]